MSIRETKIHVLLLLSSLLIDHFRILGIVMKLVCRRGSCEGISLLFLHMKRLSRMSLDCTRGPVPHRGYEYRLLTRTTKFCFTSVYIYNHAYAVFSSNEEDILIRRTRFFHLVLMVVPLPLVKKQPY